MNEAVKTNYRQKHDVAELVRACILKCKHLSTVNKRFETQFKKDNPEYTCHLRNDYLMEFSVWGNGVPYDNRFFMCVNNSRLSWEAMELETYRCDCLDYLEQLENEELYYPQLEKIEKQIKDLQELAKSLSPKSIPKSAHPRMRSEIYFWDSWSHTTRNNFPLSLND